MRRRTVAAVAALTAGLTLAGCGAVERALDCAATAVAVGDSLAALGQAVSSGVADPTGARQASTTSSGNSTGSPTTPTTSTSTGASTA